MTTEIRTGKVQHFGSHSEQRDSIIPAVRFPGQIPVCIAFTVFFIALLFWAFYGRIADSLESPGITLLSGGVVPAISPGTGKLVSLNIAPGSDVQNKQIIGSLEDPEMMLKLRQLQRDYEMLLEQEKLCPSPEQGSSVISSHLPWICSSEPQVRQGILARKLREFEDLHAYYDEISTVESPFTGKVAEVLKSTGSFVHRGENLALIASSPKKGLYLVTFIPAAHGQRVRNGMRAFFSPADAPVNRYGYIRAVVREVSMAPVTKETLLQELMNEQLADLLAGDRSVVRVVLELIPDKNTPSGYSWTGSQYYPAPVVNGVYGKVVINTEYRSPISYLFPSLSRGNRNKSGEEQ